MTSQTIKLDARINDERAAADGHPDAAGTVAETRGLTKRYGQRITAVDSLSFSLRRGEVYGLLGLNGAGKTTTLRMLVGLIRPTSGSVSVLGQPPGTPEALARTGALIETPAFYPYLSGRDNLRVMAMHAGARESSVDTALRQVDLGGRAADPFRTYSLGMKQRLGVAAALMKQPDLLILDEPTNGLDPAGMAEMRQLIRQLGQDGHTVLLSSHLMNEVEQVCDRVGVIHGGKLIAEGSVGELRGDGGLRVRATPADEARRVVSGLDGVNGARLVDGVLHINVDPVDSARVNRALNDAGVMVEELVREQASLEAVFLGLTGNKGETTNVA
jgi:ABC-2 type transport system ATP-binding protein